VLTLRWPATYCAIAPVVAVGWLRRVRSSGSNLETGRGLMKSFARSMSTILLLAGFTGSALAGVDPVRDHLRCDKVTDPSRFFAVVNLDVGFEAETVGVLDSTGCKVKLKSMKLCAPVAKTVTETDATILPVVGQDLVNGFLCYRARCPKADRASVLVSDQFGSRTVTVSATTEICTPVDY
jgi:hypothetical protein